MHGCQQETNSCSCCFWTVLKPVRNSPQKGLVGRSKAAETFRPIHSSLARRRGDTCLCFRYGDVCPFCQNRYRNAEICGNSFKCCPSGFNALAPSGYIGTLKSHFFSGSRGRNSPFSTQSNVLVIKHKITPLNLSHCTKVNENNKNILTAVKSCIIIHW